MPLHCFFVSGQAGSPLGQGVLAGCAVLSTVLSTDGRWGAPISKLE